MRGACPQLWLAGLGLALPKCEIAIDSGAADGIFPNDGAIIRLVGAILLEQNDEWAGQRSRYMTLVYVAPLSDDPFVTVPAVAR